jgi:hypothetical protein
MGWPRIKAYHTTTAEVDADIVPDDAYAMAA